MSLIDAERIVHVLSWHQIQDDEAIGEALKQIHAAGLIPQDQRRLCVIGDGAPWIWNQIKALFPSARQGLDYSHCAERVYTVAVVQYGQTLKAVEWTEATLTRLSHGEAGQVIGGLKRMATNSDASAHAVEKLMDSLGEHRHRTTYQKLRRGGYPLGSGRSLQLGEGWHSSRHTVHFWNPLILFQKENDARCYASATAYAMMIPACNACSARLKRPTPSPS